MLNLPLKQAETALRKGQLDEAFRLLRSDSARSTRAAQETVARLVTALVDRGESHLSQERLEAAAADVGKALELGGRQPQAAALFEAVQQANASRRNRQDHERKLLQQAKRQIDRGDASGGQQILGKIASDQTEVRRLAEQGDIRRELDQQLMRRVEAAVTESQYEKAIDLIAQVLRERPSHHNVGGKLDHVMKVVGETVGGELRRGRLDRAAAWRQRLAAVASESTVARELAETLDRLDLVRQSIDRQSYDEADRQLALLAELIPGSTWVAQTREDLAELTTRLASLRSGPLGLIAPVGPTPRRLSKPLSPSLRLPETLYREEEVNSCLLPTQEIPSRLLLQIDGVGSVLLLLADVVRFGAASRSDSIDFPLLTEGFRGVVQIRREGDDYLCLAEHPIDVNGRKVNSRLLSSGDVLSLGRRGRLRFQKPVAASATAMLELTGAATQRSDIRRIALFAGSLIVGASSATQIPVRGLAQRYVLYRDASRLAVRRMPTSSPADRGGAAVAIDLGRPLVIDDLRLSVTEFDATGHDAIVSRMRSL